MEADRIIEVKGVKGTLFLYPEEIWRGVSPEVLAEGLRRGKRILRRRRVDARMDRIHEGTDTGYTWAQSRSARAGRDGDPHTS